MDMPVNKFKQGLIAGKQQAGCWLSLASPVAAEICAGAGFDWVMIDMEHAPNEIPNVHAQLQAVAPYPVSPIVRPAWNDTVVMKRLLDLGVQSFIIPYVETAEEARAAVAATRYAPHGVRGVSTSSRANRYGRVTDYFKRVHDEMCVVVQLESSKGFDNLDEIAAVDGVDGVFVGPQDFAAGFGHLNNPTHPDVRAKITTALQRIRAKGKGAGILSFNEADAKGWIAQGATFVAVTSDQFLLVKNTSAVVEAFRT